MKQVKIRSLIYHDPAINWDFESENPDQKISELIASGVLGNESEYTIEIKDISHDHAMAECLAARKAAYPSPEEFLNAFFDGGQDALNALQLKRLEIKAAHPKPVKES